MTIESTFNLPRKNVVDAALRAALAVPPLWPLSANVAVNPFLGQSGEDLATTAARLERVAGTRIVMGREWYKDKIDAGEIADADLVAAISAAPSDMHQLDAAALRSHLTASCPPPAGLPSVAELVAEVSGTDWPELIVDLFGTWASGYFDEGQALWPMATDKGAWRSWRDFAMRDLRPEIAGLSGFAAHIASSPLTANDALTDSVSRLRLPSEALESYFHRLLMTMGGWAQIARYRMWQAELGGKEDDDIIQLLAIRLSWEAALFELFSEEIREKWAAAGAAYAQPVIAEQGQRMDAILQEAAERARQRDLVAAFCEDHEASPEDRSIVHAVFCIDVRSEVFRRAFEASDPQVRTSGFAGFFGLTAEHKALGSDTPEARCPVLLKPAHPTVSNEAKEAPSKETLIRIAARSKRAWGRFKLAAVSSFSFVESSGLLYVHRLIRDALGFAVPQAKSDGHPVFETALSDEDRIETAATILKAMSMTKDFARLIVFAGHGAEVVNNPHASALQCGACGGYSGEVNARLLADLLNDRKVRSGLVGKGIHIPDDTLFMGALHNTTSDTVTLYKDDLDTTAHRQVIDQASRWLDQAGRAARAERSVRLPHAGAPEKLVNRSLDWAEVRPEWGLAGCQAFVAAPRTRTRGRPLDGRAFLHDYDWRLDEGFAVLELILTAPVVVASWISLQYYGSVVAPEVFGAGNKLLHNVTGGMGVVEGNGGVLRSGLPWQSVHDGEKYMHEPLRLSVFVEAPTEAISEILSKHPDVNVLFTNHWMHLFALDSETNDVHRYRTDGGWDLETQPSKKEIRQAA